MNNLQKLIRLRGLTIKEIADRTGYGYHNVQKIIKRSTRSNSGRFTNFAIETAVATLFGLTHEQCWGPQSDTILRNLIDRAIVTQAIRAAKKLQQRYLQ
ncbi:MAG: hypothetical protein P4L42_15610 [Desulfocapsaceae bacterium]|nr:hypothetical protein [Desulfocapsaceae bacterium]